MRPPEDRTRAASGEVGVTQLGRGQGGSDGRVTPAPPSPAMQTEPAAPPLIARVMHAALFPSVGIIVASTSVMLSLVFLAYAFTGPDSPTMYTAYAFMFYLLMVTVTNASRIYSTARSLIAQSPVMKRMLRILESTTFGRLILDDIDAREFLLACPGILFGYLYTIFNLVLGIVHSSAWFISIAVYSWCINSGRVYLLRGIRRRIAADAEGPIVAEAEPSVAMDAGAHTIEGWKRYRVTGCWMLLLNSAMAGMVIQMVWQNRGYVYHDLTIYAYATYAFYAVIVAIVNLVRFHKMDDPTLLAIKTLNLAGALMSILALQTALIARFGAEAGEGFRLLANALTGTGVCVIVLGMAMFMIRRGNRMIGRVRKA